MAGLRLVENVVSVVAFDEAAARVADADDLRAEAAAIEGWYGKNPYSDFLTKHGARPDPDQAAVIGRLIGARVLASDGSMQPRLTKVERATVRAVKKRHRSEARYTQQIARLRLAIIGLAENRDDPAEVIGHVHSRFDEPVIRDQLELALDWLSRFAEEWRRRDNLTDEKASRPA
jgi:hypothetical protein